MQLTHAQKRHLYEEGYGLVLVHYLPGHAAAQNVSPHVRYAIFFRLTHVQHADRKWETMTDAWLEWEGMREIVAAHRGQE